MTESSSPLRTNLPAEPNAFVGRERDVADLRRLLEGMRAVTLCGAGGIGKTRLALHVARTMLDAHPDGVWLVELAGVRPDGTPEPVARRVAAVLDVAEEEGRRTADTLADALRGPSVLIVLDNCEHVIEECAELTGLLLARCPRMRLLATSREPLRMAGENVWRVPPLEPHEAVRLFADRARAARPGLDVTGGVEEVTRALDGMPLALELAAARVRVLSVEQIAGRLADRFRLLSAGDRTAPPRQRTLRAAIDWSHDLLDERERTLLRRLSVFAGWTLEQAEHVCADGALPAEDVLDLLTALVDKSLVAVAGEMAGQVRFHQLDSIREYASERLAGAGEDTEFRMRHRDTVLEAAEHDGRLAVAEAPGAWADRVALFRRYDAELGNVQAALAWSLDRGDIAKGLRLCTALRTFWIVRGRVAEWADWTDRFLSRAHGADPRTLGAALAGRAQLAVGGRDFVQAARYAEEALGPCQEADDPFATASALVTLAESLARAGRFEDAAGRLDEADAIAAGPGREWVRAYARITRGYLLIRRGRLREAREHLEAGATLMREIGQLWGAAHAIIGLGRLAELRGDPGGARAHYADVLPILAEIGARPEMARALAGIGRVSLEQRDLASARAALAESLSLSRSSGIRLDVARALDAFAELVAVEGDARGAVTLAGAAAALREATGRQPGGGARRERMLEPIRRRLGEPLVAQFWGEGRAMPPDDAVDYALHTNGRPQPAAANVPTTRPAPVPAPRPDQDTTEKSKQPPERRPAAQHQTRDDSGREARQNAEVTTAARHDHNDTARPTSEIRERALPTTDHEQEPDADRGLNLRPTGSRPTNLADGREQDALPARDDAREKPATERAAGSQGPAEPMGSEGAHETAVPQTRKVGPRPPSDEHSRTSPSPAETTRSEDGPEPSPVRPKATDRPRPNDEPADATRFGHKCEPGAAHAQQTSGQEPSRHVSSGESAEAAQGPAAASQSGNTREPGAVAALQTGGQESRRRASGGESAEAVEGPAGGTRFWEARASGAFDARRTSGREAGRQASGGESAEGAQGPAKTGLRSEEMQFDGVRGAGAGEGRAGREMLVGERVSGAQGPEGAIPLGGGREPSGAGTQETGAGGGLVGELRHSAEAMRAGDGPDPGAGREMESGAGGRARPFTPPSTLTAREREIARLVARGLTNRGIADELVISPATVARHVTNILTKLGYSSRAQVAVWVVETLSTED